MSSKHKMILKVIAQKANKYLVVWDNRFQEWLNEEDISPYALDIYRQIEHLNKEIVIPMEKPKSALIYCRSTTGNNDSQRNISGNYCKEKGFHIEYLVKDDVSGRKMKNRNSELGAFVPYLNSENVIIVSNPEVLGKDIFQVVGFLCEMFRKGIDIHFVEQNIVWNKETTPEEKFKIRQILNNEEFKSDQLSKEYRDKQKRLRMKGHKTGTPPFGFKAIKIKGVRKFVAHTKDQKIINDIMSLYRKLSSEKKHTNKSIYEKISVSLKKENSLLKNPNFIKNIIVKQEKIMSKSMELLQNQISSVSI